MRHPDSRLAWSSDEGGEANVRFWSVVDRLSDPEKRHFQDPTHTPEGLGVYLASA
jgi:hypothetical protein